MLFKLFKLLKKYFIFFCSHLTSIFPHFILLCAVMCQCDDFPVHQHHWHLHTLPSRGVSETGLQGDQRIHPSQNTPSEREPAAGWQALE